MDKTSRSGRIVALEGPTEIVSTQLQLLPSSRDVLILPDVDSYLTKELALDFDAVSYIKDIQEAVSKRNAAATTFLERSSPSRPRTVVLRGGTAGAVTKCIETISKCDETVGGDLAKAEAVFRKVTGRDAQSTENANVEDDFDKRVSMTETILPRAYRRPSNHPGPAAGNDRGLQSSSLNAVSASNDENESMEDIECFITTQSRRMSLPSNYSSSSSPVFLFGSPDLGRSTQEGDKARKDSEISTVEALESSAPPTATAAATHRSYGKLRRQARWQTKPEPETVAPERETEMESEAILPASTYCPTDLARTGTLHKAAARSRRNSTTKLEEIRRQSIIRGHTRNPSTVTILKLALEKPAPKENEETDAKPSPVATQPALSPTEDLVIYLKTRQFDAILDLVTKRLEDGSYSPCTRDSFGSSMETSSVPDLIPDTSSELDGTEPGRLDSGKKDVKHVSDDEYDPFAVKPTTPVVKSEPVPRNKSASPPLSARSATPVEIGLLHTVRVRHRQSPVQVQNMIRAILEKNLPVPEEESRQHQILFGTVSTWRPLFNLTQKIEKGSTARSLDMILAIGAEAGVGQDATSRVTGKVEKLGVKSDGSSRSARLDARYLISNALKSPAGHAIRDPDADSSSKTRLLAATMVDQLDSYLACNSRVKFLLLEYLPEAAQVIKVLQSLIGTEVFKIAKLIHNPLPATPSSDHGRESPIATQDRADSVKGLRVHTGSPLRHEAISTKTRDASSHSDYTLDQPATESELTTFISAIWKTLIDVSSFYALETSPKSETSRSLTSKASSTNLANKPPASPIDEFPMPLRSPIRPPLASRYTPPSTQPLSSPATPHSTHSTASIHSTHSAPHIASKSFLAPPSAFAPHRSSSKANLGGEGGFMPPQSPTTSLLSTSTAASSNLSPTQINNSGSSSRLVPNPSTADRLTGRAILAAQLRERAAAAAAYTQAQEEERKVAEMQQLHLQQQQLQFQQRPLTPRSVRSGMSGRGSTKSGKSSSLGVSVVGGDEIAVGSLGSGGVGGEDEDGMDELEMWDEEERRLMPMFMRQQNGEVRKGNSRKALKWLGLS